MSTAQRVIKNTGFLYAKMGITMFISLYITRLILNSLGATDFGIFNVVGGAIAMLGFLNAAMTSATQRFMSYSEGQGDLEKQKRIFNVSIILHFFIALFVGLVLLAAGYVFFNSILNIPSDRMHAARMIYYFMIISTMVTVMTVPYEAVLNAHENMLYFSIVGVFESLLKLATAFVVVYTMADKLVVYGALMTGISVIVMIIMRAYTHRHYSECIFAPITYWDKGLMREMTSFAGWSFMGVSSSMISQYGLGIVLNSFWGAALNAAQGIANQISGQLMVFSNTMMKALNPVIAKSEGSGDRKYMLNASMVGAKFSFLLLAIFAVPFMVETPYILKLWLKKVPDWAILFTRLQLLRSLLELLTVAIGGTISAQGDIKGYSAVKSGLNILPIILTVLLFFWGFPPYYLYITWIFAGGIVGGIITLYFSKKTCGLAYKDYTKAVLMPGLGTVALMTFFGTLPTLFMPSSFLRVLAVTAITSLLFILSFWCIFLTEKEKRLSINLIVAIKNKRGKVENFHS